MDLYIKEEKKGLFKSLKNWNKEEKKDKKIRKIIKRKHKDKDIVNMKLDILVIGTYKFNVSSFLQQVTTGTLPDRKIEYKQLICQFIINTLKDLVQEYMEFEYDFELKEECEMVLNWEELNITNDFSEAISRLLEIEFIKNDCKSLKKEQKYFLENKDMILDNLYELTISDIFQLEGLLEYPRDNINENDPPYLVTSFENFNFYYISPSQIDKKLHLFKDFILMIYCADISIFNASYSEKDIEYFDAITSSQWIKDTKPVLHLSNINEMEEKFEYYKSTYPITGLYPQFVDYCHGHVGEFEKFVTFQQDRYRWKFNGTQSLYFLRSSDDLYESIHQIIVDIVTQKTLEDVGIN